jgi:hypothetical protein
MYDLPAHHEMPINKNGDGPETNPELVTDVHCWCGMPRWPCPLEYVAEDVWTHLFDSIMSFYKAASIEDEGPVSEATFRRYLTNMFESKLGVWIDG